MGKVRELRRMGMDAEYPYESGEFAEVLIDESFSPHWLALSKMFDRPYWKRVWIVQEIVLAREAILCCGGSRAGLSHSLPDLVKFTAMPMHLLSEGCGNALKESSPLPRKLVSARMGVVPPGSKMSFLEGLIFFRNLQATDPRDHIHAALSLVDHLGFEADYRKSVLTTYRDFIQFVIQHDGNLDVLNACKHICLLKQKYFPEVRAEKPGSHLLGLRFRHATTSINDFSEMMEGLLDWDANEDVPSWIPDWRHPSHDEIYLLLKNRVNCHYKASRESKPNVHFPKDQSLIVVEGFCVDTIKASSGWPSNDELLPGPLAQEDWKLWNSGDHPQNIYGDQMKQQEAFIHTIVGGRNADGSKGPRSLTIPMANRWFELGLDESRIESHTDWDWSQYGKGIVPLIHLLLWFGICTTNEGFMGRVPRESRPGDIIVIFLGGKTPYVLRKYPSDDKYYLVGECCK
jgi:hypothetical protein